MPYTAAMTWIAFGCFVLLSTVIEAITGFGGTLIALALGALLLPMADLVPTLVCLSALLSWVMVAKHYRDVNLRLLLTVILPGMVLGTAIGYMLKAHINPEIARRIFGVFIIWAASRNLWLLRKQSLGTGEEKSTKPSWLTYGFTGLSGFTHGLYGTGGPILVYALSALKLSKAAFRATLLMVWLVLNTSLSIAYLVDGELLRVKNLVLALIPVVIVGIVIGEYLHSRVSEQKFKQWVFSLLFLTGIALVLK